MSPALPALPRSDSKARLLNHIGLDMRDNMHRRIYTLMKLEASEGRKRIIAVLDARATAVGAAPGSSRQSSYSTSQVDEEIMDEEVRRIYHTAQPTTKTLYDLAVDPELPERPNWIIRWMLWHVFRYRDGRQAQKPVGANDAVGNGDESPSPTSQVAVPVTMTRGSGADGHGHYRGYFDPVRGRYRN